MIEIFVNIVPKFEVKNQCESIVCQNIVLEKTYGEKFIDFIESIKIKWYCRGCMWEKGRRDCSSFISKYLIDNWVINKRINSYILSQYWIQKNIVDMKRGDIVVMYNKWTWSHHTAVFWWYDSWGILIYDLYEKKTEWSVRYVPRLSKYKIYLIWNPVEYWFKKSFYSSYGNFVKK